MNLDIFAFENSGLIVDIESPCGSLLVLAVKIHPDDCISINIVLSDYALAIDRST